ncbi:cytochrome c oxidase assembly protein [Nocardia sp. 2]|uniref:Cytochrome c oxidase assembly protein n=1 Tax=Nocardia acididurans TaxID=2802282 RepID=A0ABS1M5D2_9NOCA|nr:cytochrome c oxidase assembly protein [Nocardia acididurans]MBL1075409.1 cytochrome c oxidase assembly protein [Nocardia acididurans]
MIAMPPLAGSIHLPDAPPSIGAMLAWNPQHVPLLPVVAIALALLYIRGVLRMRETGRAWAWWRTASFLSGCLALFLVTGLAIEGYGFRLFSAWMFQHLTLSMLIPPLWVLGSPGVLLLRATPHHGVGRLVLGAALTALRSRAARVLLHHGFTIPVFLFSYYAVYLTSILDVVGSNLAGHLALEVFFLAGGLLFIVPVLSTGPLPFRQTNLGRFFDLFVEMPLHVFIGVILMMASAPMVALFADPPAGWNVDVLADQKLAGGLAWSYGEPVALIVVLVFAARWRRDEVRESSIAEKYDRDGGGSELLAYNAFLESLHDKSGKTPYASENPKA